MSEVSVNINKVTKRFGSVTAVDELSLEIRPGELFTLLGPSGCGKTTLLRTIAGFYYQDSGSIAFDNKSIDGVPPHKRDTGMVFQSYAIFPFLTVFDNIAYGLKVRHVGKREIRERVMRALDLVRLSGYENRRPDQLSGGQRQRVAVARAIVIEPTVLLMDEPLSNLDAKLRVGMRVDLKLLQKQLGITMVYVTHDQEEALAISDRIAVMSKGKIVQVGSSWDIYHKPASPYVANFIGVTNFFHCPVRSHTGTTVRALFEEQEIELPYAADADVKEVVISIRPESLHLCDSSVHSTTERLVFRGSVVDTTYLGSFLRVVADTPSGVRFQAEVNNPGPSDILEPGSEIFVAADSSELSVFSGQAIDD